MNGWLLLCLVLTSWSISLSSQRSTRDDPDYKVAIVEFTPELPTVNWELRTVLHFKNYTRIVSEAADDGVDILIFPEYTLNNVAFPVNVPDPVDQVNPCLHPERFDNLLVDLSCLARENEIYLCINLNEKEDCTEELQQTRNDSRPCSSLGITRYNTNVVFDRNGTVISRYRKFNLFREGGVNTTHVAELSTFETDFGVTFGIIICFDVLFFEPAMQLVQKGIKNFIFSAMWTSELPFLNSNQIYHSWAYRNSINLFAAGTNFAPAVATGSGFFMGKSGSIFSIFTENPLRDFFLLKVPKDSLQSNHSFINLPEPVENSFANLRFGRDFIDNFETELIDFAALPVNKRLCHNSHCCDFSIDAEPVTSNSSFEYRYVSFNGHRSYSGWGDKKLVICAIIICNDLTLDSCARVPNFNLDRVTFNKIEITTNFKRFGVLMMPNSLDMNMNPLNVNEFFYDEDVTSETLRTSMISLLKPHSDLQTFALYGHDFEVNEEFNFERKKQSERMLNKKTLT